uniref:Integrase-type domain-containing protein n=1 Tax=Labrus bergylta TaxID=56723 RepID=A0A3Q3G336_9LABR
MYTLSLSLSLPLSLSRATMINETTTKPSDTPLLQTTPTTPLSPNTPTTATHSQSFQPESSTMGMESTTSATTAVTSEASNPTMTTRVPPTLSDTGNTTTSKFTREKTTESSSPPAQSTNLISTTVSNEYQSTVPGATESTVVFKTSKATTKTPFIHTKTKTRQDPPIKQSDNSKAVAGIIGGALVLMMVGFLVIYIKKRKLQRHQITTKDWAGPSPFLEGGADNGQVTQRSSNRISLSSFLPQRLSKRLSLLPETDEEMEDMVPGSTFGNKNEGSTFGREVNGNDKETNGMAGGDEETTQDTVENSESSSQTQDPLTTNDNSGDAKVSQDPPASPTALSGAGENLPEPPPE